MKILRLLNNNLYIIIIFFFLGLSSLAEDQPADIWNLNKDESLPSSQQEVLDIENENMLKKKSGIGIYEMQAQGLRQVKNPSEVLISAKDEVLSGHAIAATVEGIRPMMIEVQALVSSAVYGTPQRSCTGFNAKRLNMLLAVLEKRAGFALGSKDVFINITGGINIEDPALDLAVIAALLSSYHDLPISQHICFAAEIGLSGEIRPVVKAELRIQEAEKLGFESIAISKFTKLGAPSKKIKSLPFNKVEALVDFLF